MLKRKYNIKMNIPTPPDVKIDVLKMDIDNKKLDIFIKYLNIKYKI